MTQCAHTALTLKSSLIPRVLSWEMKSNTRAVGQFEAFSVHLHWKHQTFAPWSWFYFVFDISLWFCFPSELTQGRSCLLSLRCFLSSDKRQLLTVSPSQDTVVLQSQISSYENANNKRNVASNDVNECLTSTSLRPLVGETLCFQCLFLWITMSWWCNPNDQQANSSLPSGISHVSGWIKGLFWPNQGGWLLERLEDESSWFGWVFNLFLSSLKVKSLFLLMEFGGLKESNTRNLFWFWSFPFKDTSWHTIRNVFNDVQTTEIHPEADEDIDSHDPTRRTSFASLSIEKDLVAEKTFYHKTNCDFLPSAHWKTLLLLVSGLLSNT